MSFRTLRETAHAFFLRPRRASFFASTLNNNSSPPAAAAAVRRAAAAAVEGLEGRQLFAATFDVTGLPSVNEGAPYTLTLPAADDSVTGVTIDWGDGTAPQAVPSGVTSVEHTFVDGDADVTVTATATVTTPGGGEGGDPVGALDAEFAAGGTLAVDFGAGSYVLDTAVQGDGKIVVVGTVPDEGGVMVRGFVARYNADGSPDTAFAANGRSIDHTALTFAGSYEKVAVLANGDIQVLGKRDNVVFLARFNANGNPSHVVTPDFFPDDELSVGDLHVRDMTLDGAGRTLVTGTLTYGGLLYAAVARFDAAGNLDHAFGTGGASPLAGSSGIAAARIDTLSGDQYLAQNQGASATLVGDRIVVGGSVTRTRFNEELGMEETSERYSVYAFTDDGQLDKSFGVDDESEGANPADRTGYAEAAFDLPMAAAWGVGALPDGSVVVAGTLISAEYQSSIGLARFTPAGMPDANFGTDGRVVDSFGSANQAFDLAVTADGKLLVTGALGVDAGGDAGVEVRYAAVRFTADGARDGSFAPGGAYLGPANVAANAVVQQPDGKLLVVGNDGMVGTVTRFDTAGGGGGGETVVVTDTLDVHVANVAPQVTLAGPSTGVRLVETLTFTGAFADPGADAWAATIDFGDGTAAQPLTLGAGKSFSAGHVFGATGTFNVTVTVSETEAGGASGTAVIPVTVSAAKVLADPVDPTKTMLLVGGSNGGDSVNVTANNAGVVTVSVGGQSVGTFSPTGRVRVFAGAGNDVVNIANSVPVLAEVYGGDGNDILNGGNAGNILVGGAGLDVVAAGTGRDILIGGLGADSLSGNPGDDILVAGYTVYDNDPAALATLYATWGRTDRTYAQRVAAITSSTAAVGLRANGSLATGQTVFDDSANDVLSFDLLTGGGGQDWYFANTTTGSAAEGFIPDVIIGGGNNETRTDIDTV